MQVLCGASASSAKAAKPSPDVVELRKDIGRKQHQSSEAIARCRSAPQGNSALLVLKPPPFEKRNGSEVTMKRSAPPGFEESMVTTTPYSVKVLKKLCGSTNRSQSGLRELGEGGESSNLL